ncbi:hypothetical protein A3758_17180 [Oleiphilus sp. HI0118]|uniref:helix-turn-helix transcriptional regulator n=1 Tax=Oleiphilus sp. HI0079 TaxID=1822254 RepID=UPI0007C403C9|nr:AlpA family phage regulatory protein [Oleiphilus sp. HI0079]KZZ09551.1 hypothetical protein A3750_09015 [Oleiphilus sp. HI0079]KZZ47292.1 hypothetical protein A3758_17590 [Oleiphilus sp. HI0118]KZZ48680.1 hypothetical protein A3758_17180 [Oleiphilus sp. HI0118]
MAVKNKFLKRRDVLDMTAQSDTSLDRSVRAGVFPPPVRIFGSPTSVRWIEYEVLKVINASIEGFTEVQLKELVQKLVAARPHYSFES